VALTFYNLLPAGTFSLFLAPSAWLDAGRGIRAALSLVLLDGATAIKIATILGGVDTLDSERGI